MDCMDLVALLAEGVDRNLFIGLLLLLLRESPSSRRAWIEIALERKEHVKIYGSPSSRRAWIEIVPKMSFYENNRVALLAEGVDRNIGGNHIGAREIKSPSSRRAWIEIVENQLSWMGRACRPPRGGRG